MQPNFDALYNSYRVLLSRVFVLEFRDCAPHLRYVCSVFVAVSISSNSKSRMLRSTSWCRTQIAVIPSIHTNLKTVKLVRTREQKMNATALQSQISNFQIESKRFFENHDNQWLQSPHWKLMFRFVNSNCFNVKD